MKSAIVAVSAAGALVLVGVLPAAATPMSRAPATVAAVSPGVCSSLVALSLPNTTVTAAATVAASGTVPATCQVHAVLTHPPSGDAVNIDVWMPVQSWNGRFEGTGGGVYFGGFVQSLAAPVSQGFAAA